MERRLSAILAVDVVGYSRLMEKDEAGTFERLREHRKDLFEPEIAAHHGRIFKLTGDGLLAEFGSVVDAVECAVLLQREMAERNNGLSDERRIDVRMGVHVGDVIIEGDDRHGDAVNIAARLQQLAEGGGICVSGAVADQVRHKVALQFEPRGEERLKNIAEPVRIYRVAVGNVPALRSALSRRLAMWGAVVGVLVVAAGVATALRILPIDGGAPSAPVTPESALGIPIILVLPFQNLTNDPAQDKLGLGIAEELRDLLWTYPEFQVVSGTTSVNSRGDLRDIARKHNAQFVIEGTVRRTGDKAVVIAQLIEGTSDMHLESYRMEEAFSDPVLLERAVAQRLFEHLGGIAGTVRQAYERIAFGKAEADLSEYDYYVRGHWQFNHWTKEDMAKARETFAAGLARYPDSVLLRIKTAFSYYQDVEWWWTDDPQGDIDRARQLVADSSTLLAGRRSTRFEDFYLHWVRTYAYQADAKYEQCVAEAKSAADFSPYDDYLLGSLVWRATDCGDPEKGIEWAQKAIRLNPQGPPWGAEQHVEALARAYLFAGRYEEAVATIAKMKEQPLRALAVSYLHLGKVAEAQSLMATWVKDNPGWTIKAEAPFRIKMVGPFEQRWFDDLRTLGMPEE
jgi:class 3 adenylate cyclase/TolB-like protein